MTGRGRAMKLVRFVLPISALPIVALAIILGLVVARPSDASHQLPVAEITLAPDTSHQLPLVGPPGSIFDFTVQLVPNGVEVTAVQLSMAWDSQLLEMVDASGNPATVFTFSTDGHFNPNEPGFFGPENEVDNASGTGFLLAGRTTGTSEDTDVVDIRFRVKDGAPADGLPTDIRFLVDDDRETQASGGGELLLVNTEDFIGASISIRAAEIVMLPDSLQVPIELSPGGTVDFIVRAILNGVEATGVQLSMTWDTQSLEMVDAGGSPATRFTFSAEGYFNPNQVGFFGPVNEVDNSSGTGVLTVGRTPGTSEDTDVVDIRFRAKDNAPTGGEPTEVVFLVDGDRETQIGRSGLELIYPPADFVGARIAVAIEEPTVEEPTVSLTGPDSANRGDTKSYSFAITDLDGSFTIPNGFPDCGSAGSLVANSVNTTPTGGSFECSFPTGPASSTVRIQVANSDGALSNIASIAVTVSDSDVQLNDWNAIVVVSGSVGGSPLQSGVDLDFGLHPDALDIGDVRDEPFISSPGQTLMFYFLYPENVSAFQQLTKSKIAPPASERDILTWPVFINVMLPTPVAAAGGEDVTVNINWDIDPIPSGFTTALLIDQGSLPANEVVNMGATNSYQYTVNIPQFSTSAIRIFTIAVSNSHVQAARLYDEWNLFSLSVQPDSSQPADILKDVTFLSVLRWDPDAGKPSEQRGRRLTRATDFAEPMIPGIGFWIFVLGDSIQLIAGDPIAENVRSVPP